MRDAYEVLGIKRGASLQEVKAAYRRACKKAHPDMGGSHEAMIELNTAYAFILSELKHDFQAQQSQQQQERASEEGVWQDVNAEDEQRARYWRDIYKDIDDELEQLRRAAEEHDERLRTMRRMAWERGDRTGWLKLTWEDLFAFIRSIARSGLKGLALLFAALMGVGGALLEINLVSALIVIGSGLGLIFSLALKSDKGGLMSAALLLFGIMTLWLPPVRMAFFTHPFITINVLVCLALIFKFAREGGTVGLATGGVLALYMIFVILSDTGPQQRVAIAPRAGTPHAPEVQQRAPDIARPIPQVTPRETAAASPPPPTRQPPAPPPPEERTLIASDGAILKFVPGVVYHLKVRTGFSTSISATQGRFALYAGDAVKAACSPIMQFAPLPGFGPYQEIAETIRSCDGDTIANVVSAQASTP
jgi:hypothetical protein